MMIKEERYCLRLKIEDATGYLNVIAFENEAETLTKTPAKALYDLYNQDKDDSSQTTINSKVKQIDAIGSEEAQNYKLKKRKLRKIIYSLLGRGGCVEVLGACGWLGGGVLLFFYVVVWCWVVGVGVIVANGVEMARGGRGRGHTVGRGRGGPRRGPLANKPTLNQKSLASILIVQDIPPAPVVPEKACSYREALSKALAIEQNDFEERKSKDLRNAVRLDQRPDKGKAVQSQYENLGPKRQKIGITDGVSARVMGRQLAFGVCWNYGAKGHAKRFCLKPNRGPQPLR
ncbi:hypothetical protein GIB67_019312 [Kingdonia uniflora]|uniref:Uncharacterized protein n=1 Tax=Kingdonia uniflora TaxID=39325 RepID=A0A7J7M1N0_9MAGN|nr:hypothetical protein GIB67_019312 [Kingdonia uniflora]